MPPPPRFVGAGPRGSAPVLAVVVPDAVPGAVVPDAVVLPTAVVPEAALDAGFVAAPALVAVVAEAAGVADVAPVVADVLGVLVALPPQAASRRGNAIMSTESFPRGRRN